VRHIHDAVNQAAERTTTRVLAIAVLSEHVHLLVAFRPDVPLSSFIRHAKSESARRINLAAPRDFHWCRGYFAGSVSRGHLDLVRAYVGRQYARHPDKVPVPRAQPRGVAPGLG